MVSLGAFLVAADHPSLPGHFPGRPLAPGVLLLDETAALIAAAHPGLRVDGFPAVRFLHPVRPGDVVEVVADDAGFRCAVDGRPVLSGRFTLGPRA